MLDQPQWWQDAKKEHIIPWLLCNGKLMLGKAGTAKTPDNFIDGFAVSRYHGDQKGIKDWMGEVRTGSNLDFFRLDSGAIERPDLLDDCDLDKVEAAKRNLEGGLHGRHPQPGHPRSLRGHIY